MKKRSIALALVMSAFVITSAYAADAPAVDGCAVAPQHCKILKEDAKVRVVDYTAKKGDKVPMHSHPAHVVYVLEGGKTKFTMPDGTTKEIDAKPGEAIINPATTHSADHLTDIHVIIVEMKP
jgi:quercetin dioxygenase-like cupin family protein